MSDVKRDRSGEIFQNDTTENEGARRGEIEDQQAKLQPDPDVDSQEADEKNPAFARELKKTGHASGN